MKFSYKKQKEFLTVGRYQPPEVCEAVQQSDQKVCTRCGFVWDMNDPDPPKCLSPYEVGKRHIDKLKKDVLKGGDYVR